MNTAFYNLGVWVAGHPKRVLGAWIVVVLLGAWGAYRLPAATVGGTGDIPGSSSAAVTAALEHDFNDPFIDPLVVAVSAPGLDVAREPYAGWMAHAASALRALREVRAVNTQAGRRDPAQRSFNGHVSSLVVGLAADDAAGRQAGVQAVDAALAPLRSRLRELDPKARVALTGGPASDVDLNALSASGGHVAETRALPLTLIILAVVFGTLTAALLPFMMGLATTTVALGAACLLAHAVPVSNLLSNVVTMVGLAIGIDYSLLTVTRFREHDAGVSLARRVAETVASAGRTISWSGVTVIAGFLGLLFSPILETRCAGMGGALVVLVSVLAALTLLPAVLMVCGSRLDRWPLIPARWRTANSGRMWAALGALIVRHPVATLLLAGAGVASLALPLVWANFGATNARWFLPEAAQSRQGADILAAMGDADPAPPLDVILATTDGTPILDAAHRGALVDFVARWTHDRRVFAVDSPLTRRSPRGGPAGQAPAAEPSVSRDGRQVLIEINPRGGLQSGALGALAHDVAASAPRGPFVVRVGGELGDDTDVVTAMTRSLPRIAGFVIGMTLLIVFTAFRSLLLPLKAVVTNLLAVGAGLGAVVAVFQFGWLAGVVGLERPFDAVPLEVPMMVFCLSFGLSMDYELFLLFHIQREYALDGNNARATIAGMSAVAPVITGAALIMAVVFGAFIGADLPVLKMMGVGLMVSVLIDATVIRGFLVPAVMVLAGRWNWYPGVRHPSSAAVAPRAADMPRPR